jgi:hypothetical protein
MKRFSVFNALVCAAAFAAVASDIQAASVFSLLEIGANQASDEDREFLIDNVVTVPGQIDVGDAFRGHIDFNTLNSGSANLGGLTGNNELSGVFQVRVATKVVAGPITFFTFEPDPTFVEGGVAGAIIVLFEDSTPDFVADFDDPNAGLLALLPDDGTLHLPPHPGSGPTHTPPSSTDVGTGLTVTEELFIDTATNGTRFATFGFNGQAGEGFNAISTSGDNVLTFFTITSGTAGANNNFALSRLDGPGAETFDDVVLGPTPSPFPLPVGTPGFIGVVGSQQLRGVADLDTAFEISTNTNVSFNIQAVVPEPCSFALLALGAIPVAVSRCRRRRASVQQDA